MQRIQITVVPLLSVKINNSITIIVLFKHMYYNIKINNTIYTYMHIYTYINIYNFMHYLDNSERQIELRASLPPAQR